jgi:microcystin-dependent protein
MADQFVAEIRPFAFSFPPIGWAFCAGQILPLAQNTALFSLLGTMYGGNGMSNFALPNLQGRAPLGAGQGPGLSPYDQGQDGGTETVTLLPSEMPAHSHALVAADAGGDLRAPGSGRALAAPTNGALYAPSTSAQQALHGSELAQSGGSAPHNNMQPYLTLNFCIALQGIFPPRG